MVGELFDTYGRPVIVPVGQDEGSGLTDNYGRPFKVLDGYRRTAALTTDHTYSGESVSGTVGENVAFPDLLYLKSDGKYWKADADASTTMPALVMASATILADADGVLILPGSFVRDDTWNWTIGGVIYASGTAAGLTQTASTAYNQVVGVAITADIIFFNPLHWVLPLSGGTMTGDINLGANKLITTNLLLKESGGLLALRNAADSAYGVLDAASYYARSNPALLFAANGQYIRPGDTDDWYWEIWARDTGVASLAIMRFAGAADPYVRIGRDDTGVALNAVCDMLVLQGGGGTGNEAAGFGLGTSWKIGNASSEVEERGSVDLALVTATNAAEDARFNISVMGGGAMIANLFQLDKTGLTILNTATEPSTTANQASIACVDISAGNASLAFATETAVVAAIGIASTHKIPVRWNGATYYLMASNV